MWKSKVYTSSFFFFRTQNSQDLNRLLVKFIFVVGDGFCADVECTTLGVCTLAPSCRASRTSSAQTAGAAILAGFKTLPSAFVGALPLPLVALLRPPQRRCECSWASNATRISLCSGAVVPRV